MNQKLADHTIEWIEIGVMVVAAESGVDSLIMNPAGFSYAGHALRDSLKGVALPYVEVHISNIETRGIHCVLSDIAIGMITGFGPHGYVMGLDAMLHLLAEHHE